MRYLSLRTLRGLSLTALLIALGARAEAAAPPAPPKPPAASYRVVVEPQKKSLHVVGDFADAKGKTVRLSFPSWSPGVYRFRPLSSVIANLTITDGKGKTLPAKKLETDTWEVTKGEKDSLRVEYDLDVSDKNQHIDKTFLSDKLLLFRAASALCYLEGRSDRPASVSFVAPDGWKFATSLEAEESGGGAYRAKDFHELIDSPLMAGDFSTETVSTGKTTFVIAVDAQLGFAPARLSETVKKLAAYQVALFGDAPFRTYTLLIHAIPDTYFNTVSSGMIGVEHQRGTVISVTPQYARVVRGATDVARAFESIVAHEIFHSWNGKRIRPAELSRPDLQRAVRTPNLWFVEGVTRYYDILSVHRALGRPESELYADLAKIIRDGSVSRSLALDSLQASTTLSRNLYTKGALVAFALDLRIRKLTDNARSLDDVLRRLDAGAARSETYTDASLRRAVEAVAGVSLEEFFARYVAGAEQLDINDYLGDAGLRASVRREVAPQDVGIYFNRANNRIVGLVNGGAGYDSGLQPGDTVLSINGEAIQTRPFTEFFKKEETVGSVYTFRVMRAEKELTFDVGIKQRETVTVEIVETATATTQQLKVRRGLLGGWNGAAEGQKARLTAWPPLATRAFLPA